ncbi:39S ribosomal protein L23, mitochondrial-like [Eurytemora carolleeae]|uniref:39S ribosomal protein L23, mitochondrial-like n=1 Tax=Eurytemora carolleeae TaxID=1294199 RepID=UPI000C787580|nr:39S ribosomal protein L23, mitochondrial-like [Eurytemora carolleeae]|eukprot:XP_023338825.1 39S ribosomal protein L23, mitochondrial-like [Eurytemora affinis]
MSTRWYPLYKRGNPQLRVFMPNFWMKLVNLEKITVPSNKVNFIISREMTKYDVKNYLEQIYKVPVLDVRTLNQMGKVRPNPFNKGQLIKDPDTRFAFVTLAPGTKFEFPDLKIDKQNEQMETSNEEVESSKQEFKKSVHASGQKYRPGVPTFFGL